MPPSAYWRRRIGRHVVLAALTAGLVGFVYAGVPTDFILRRWNLATGYVGLAWLALTLLIGPWNAWRGRPNPPSQDLRRDVGIWAALVSLAHVVIGLQIHMQGQSRLTYFVPPAQPMRGMPESLMRVFLFANWTGLASTLVLILLLAISNDVALRRLGTARWKSLQRWNYAGFALMAAHAIAYQVMEKRVLPVIVVFAGTVAIVLFAQIAIRVRPPEPRRGPAS
jgi:methionine sulfoxide reductase heme-binding subunit